MSDGGFCEQHGPFDPPHAVCPYCVMEPRIPEPPGGLPNLKQSSNFGNATPPPHPMPNTDDEATVSHLNVAAPDSAKPLRKSPMRPAPPRGEVVQDPGAIGLLLVRVPVDKRGRVYRVESGQVIGRMDADVRVNDRRVSRQHARINVEIDPENDHLQFVIYDFGTANGTFVNGNRVDGRALLIEGDDVQMGDHVFSFKTLSRSHGEGL